MQASVEAPFRLPLGAASGRPAVPVVRTEADRPHLVEADHDPALGRPAVQGEDTRGLGLVVGVGTCLPRARALEGEAGAGEQPPQLRRRDLKPPPGQVAGERAQAPAGEGHPERVGTGAGDGDDALLVVSRDPAGVVRGFLCMPEGLSAGVVTISA